MTVCVAAIYNDNAILGASDRMVTGGYGDITFEPPTPKILTLTTSIAVMTAGDQNIQMQVFQKVSQEVNREINENPEKWLEVSTVAEMYSKAFYHLKNQLIEKQILSQYSLTLESFVSRQREMSQEFVDMIAMRINRFEIDYIRERSIETILIGNDEHGPHIYVVRNGVIVCNDKLGFAAIGIGSNHALSHFMLSAYSRLDTESKALLTIHQAKKKSEVSPGVGKDTDMCVIGSRLGTFTMLTAESFGRDIVKDLDGFYKIYTKGIKRLNMTAENNIKQYLSRAYPPPSLPQEISVSPSPSAAADEKPEGRESDDATEKTGIKSKKKKNK